MGTIHTPAGIPLGPFVLDEVIGRAGMGVVWRGTHVDQKVPVAVKVLTLKGSRDPLYQACLRNEVRGVAALDHPAVVRVYDQGVLPESVSQAVGGELAPGSPYLVMELAEGGTLLPLCGRLGWAQVWRVLARVLEGLAHAHARGVIHRDIKPSNILLRKKGAGVLVTDFGLARAGDREQDGSAFLDVGTPAYMAPEQILRAWRDIGPWTDLYSVGCVATALVSARPPFVSDNLEDVIRAHVNQPVPPLDPLVDVPDGFEDWVLRLLHKSHNLRFRRAADALHALWKLVDEADANVQVVLEPRPSDGPKMSENTTGLRALGGISGGVALPASDTAVLDPDRRVGSATGPVPGPLPELSPSLALCDYPDLPPVLDTWRQDAEPRRSMGLLGTGLGIFGFRNLPVIGREAEQDRLWATLKSITKDQAGQAMVLSGGDGSGRSHLAAWLTQRAHETGAASVLRVDLRDMAGAVEVLAPIVHSLLHTSDLSRTKTRERVQMALSHLGASDDVEVDALVALLGPYPGEEREQEVEFERAKARYVLVRRLLQRATILRPIILVLEDAHLSEDAIAFARHMLRAQEYSPHSILLVLTVGGMGLSDQVRAHVREFQELPMVQTLELGPLEPEHRTILVREILGLAPVLAEIVERRSGGNPQFAVQLVGDWVQKGQLELGPGGFRMRPGVTPDIPADLQAIWERRLAAAVPLDRDVHSLELAAVMGLEVDPSQWTEACNRLGVSPDWDLVDQLLEAQLAVPGQTFRSWRFGHFLVADALRRQAEFGGRIQAQHAAAVDVLRGRDEAEVAPILGRHLMGARLYKEALPVLLRGAVGCIHRSEWNRAWALLREREEALRKLGIPMQDPLWAEGWLAKAGAVGVRNNLDTSTDMYRRVLDMAEPGTHIAAQALYGLGRMARIQGAIPKSRELLGKARAMSAEYPDLLAGILIQLGSLEANYGETAESRETYQEALQAAEECGDLGIINDVKYHMSGLFRRIGDEGSARSVLNEVRAWCLANGRRERLAQCANDLAEMDRLHGDSEAAKLGYQESLRLYEAVGARQSYVALANLGIMAAEQGHTVEAREHLDRVVPMVQRMGLRGIEGLAHSVLVLVEAHDQRWEAWDQEMEVGKALLEETGFVDIDVARAFEQAGRVCLAAGEVDRARRVLASAQQHWEVLEREEQSARVGDLLGEIGSLE